MGQSAQPNKSDQNNSGLNKEQGDQNRPNQGQTNPSQKSEQNPDGQQAGQKGAGKPTGKETPITAQQKPQQGQQGKGNSPQNR